MKCTAALLAILALALASCKDKLPTQGDEAGEANRIFYCTGYDHTVNTMIWSTRPDGSDIRKIAVGAIASPPRAGRIAYGVRDSGGLYAVYVAAADGRNPVEIRLGGVRYWAASLPILSPDGKWVACMKNNAFLAVLPSDGSQPYARDTGSHIAARYGDPAFAPNGQWIAYAYVYEDFLMMVPFGAGGRDAVVAGNYVETLTRPVILSWSPTGDRLAYVVVGSSSPDHDICTMRADGSGIARITNDHMGDDMSPAWSPDGSRIAFIRDSTILCLVGADGGAITRLTVQAGGKLAYPAWSPDGRKILVVVKGDAIDFVYMVDTDTRLTTLMTDRAGRAFWTP